MARIAFASYEIAPTTKGGAGVLIRNLADVLLRAGHELIMVLDLPPWEFEQFVSVHRFVLPEAENCRAYHVGSIVDGLDGLEEEDFSTHFEWRAYRFHLACKVVVELEQPDLLEFFDYGGVGYHALSAKVAGLAYPSTHIAIRLHTSLELMDRVAADVIHDLEREGVFALEHGALRLAETVLYPTPSYLKEAYLPYYEPWLGSAVESPPPIIDIPAPRRLGENPNVVLFYGRLAPLKGIDLFLDAALAMIRQGEAMDLQFYMVGFDPRYPEASYRAGEEIRRRIPEAFQDRFVFKGQWDRHRLELLFPRVKFAVFPTQIESFGYAVHELRHAGVPMVLSSIPAFRDAFTNGVDALFFDGSSVDLQRQMKMINEDDTFRAELGRPPSAQVEPQISFYGSMHQSWIANPGSKALRPRPVICVLVEGEDGPEPTLTSIGRIRGSSPLVHVLRRLDDDASESDGIRFLGRRWTVESEDGFALQPADLVTSEALLVLRAGDRVDPWFLDRCSDILARQPEVAYVSSWKQLNARSVDTFPADLMPEAIPLLGRSPLTRSLLRTEPGVRLDEVFDGKAGVLGEIMHLCSNPVGITVPEVGLVINDEGVHIPSEDEIAIMAQAPLTKWQRERLGRLRAIASSDREALTADAQRHLDSQEPLPLGARDRGESP
jgi:glycosyltransferase involved in cell wall biosynthesis